VTINAWPPRLLVRRSSFVAARIRLAETGGTRVPTGTGAIAAAALFALRGTGFTAAEDPAITNDETMAPESSAAATHVEIHA
jgi:hypothetical protein